ncbi:MAG TPA: immunoglobulin domain-containing protein, partial [Verrucomicrobiae bacterium]|nr:immunoglobulin domain-containing protein [Verrucomicrobiae bacterium]
MKKASFLVFFLLSFATAAFAILPCYEPFANSVGLFPTGTAYAAGSPGWHQTNAQGDFWLEINSTGGGPSIYLTNFSLFYPGLPASTGNAIVLTNAAGAGMRINTASPQIFETQNGVKLYYSMLVSVPNIASLPTTGDYCWGFNNGSGDQGNQPSDFHARIYFKKNGAGYQLGIARTTSVAYDSTVHSTNETVFIVASYEIVTTNSSGSSSTTNDICRLWINPNTNTFGAAAPPGENTNTIVFTDADETTSPNTFILANRSTTQPNILIVDDFRLGTNWAFVTGAVAVKTPPPATKTVAFGATLSLTNRATGSSSVIYQWQFNGTNIAGATASILTIANMADPNAGTYSSIVSTGIGSSITNATVVTVTGDPQFVLQPVNLNAPTGGGGSFTANAIGTAVLTYQWFENGFPLTDGTSGTGTVFSGSHTTNLNLSSISTGDSGAAFYCMATNGVGVTATSSSATLTVEDPVIISGPNNATADYQGTTNFSVVVGGTSPFGYQWYYNGSPLTDGPSPSGSGATISGSSTSNLTVSGVTYQDSGSSYYVVVTNANNNTVGSPSASLTVLDPYIATQPAKQTNSAGGTATLTVVAAGTPTLTYQWYQNNNPLSDGAGPGGSAISGSGTASLTISGLNDGNAGNYYVAITGGSGYSTNSATNALTIIDPLAIVSPPKSLVERAGDHLAFTIGVTGTSPTYQWQFNGTNIAGATKSSLVLTNIQTGSNGTYTVNVVNAISTNSASATLNVINSSILPLASTNIIVARIGDGAQAFSGAGNTIYFDQYTTNGVYVSTFQVPDENIGQGYGTGSSGSVYGSPALLAQGGTGNDSVNSTFLTVSAGNQQFLNFSGYCEQYPFSGSDVTVSGNIYSRGFASINAFGVYSLLYTNSGIYNATGHTIRSIVTLDDANFWVIGQAGSVGGAKFVNISYGSGIPTIASSLADARLIQIVGGNVIFSDVSGASGAGLYACAGTPEPVIGAGTTPSTLILNEGGVPNDFAFSPDGQTVYIADS